MLIFTPRSLAVSIIVWSDSTVNLTADSLNSAVYCFVDLFDTLDTLHFDVFYTCLCVRKTIAGSLVGSNEVSAFGNRGLILASQDVVS